MVCISVLLTGIVMHISSLQQPMPKWIRRVFLEILPPILCLSNLINMEKNMGIIENEQIDGGDETGDLIDEKQPSSENDVIVKLLEYIREDIQRKTHDSLQNLQWRRLSVIIDRIFLILFTAFVMACTIYLTLDIVSGSQKEYDDILDDLEENWSLDI